MPFVMGDGDKPFVCRTEGCNMTFANEDHLNVHHKKHDMVLNLGLAKTPTIADQTPTPTRFIRNCEEVGLFQDLQNVNPFEETFRKAVENTKNGTIHVPESISEDSLHTPQIFHTAEKSTPQKYERDDLPEDFSLHSVIHIHDVSKTDKEPDDIYDNGEETAKISFRSVMFESEKDIDLCSSNSSETILADDTPNSTEEVRKLTIDDLTNKNIDLKAELREKLKEALHKRRIEEDPLQISDTERLFINMHRPKLEVTSKLLYHGHGVQSKKPRGRIKDINIYDKNVSEVDKRRLMNRMAQMRSRERKKLWLDQMKDDMIKLRTENKDLIAENKNLKEENVYLKSVLLKHNNCSLNIDVQKETTAQPTSVVNKKLKPIKPRPTILTPISAKMSQTSQVVTKIQIPSTQLDINSSKVIQPMPSSKDLPLILPKPVILTQSPVVGKTPVIKHTSVVPQSTVLTPISTPIITSQSPILAKTLSSINLSNDSSMIIQVKMPQAVMLELKPRKGKS